LAPEAGIWHACDLIHKRPELAVLPAGYQRVFNRAVDVLAGDGRVRAMWLGGSLATGTADRASDLDVLLAVDNATHGPFADAWRDWLAEITPTVLAEPLPFLRGSFYSVTPDFERLDVVLEPASAVPSTPFRHRLTVFDRDALSERVPWPEAPGPRAASVADLIQEFFLHSAKVEVLVWRADWLVGAEHAHWLRNCVYRLYVEANAPLPPSGLKHLAAKLTPTQQTALAAIPTGIDDAAGLVAAHRAAADAFLPTARRLAGDLDLSWPHELEAAAARHIEAILGLPAPYGPGD
jgi:hypothetical protein